MTDRSHGSPYDRGDSDAYYRRQFRPHRWTTPNGRATTDLTPSEIEEYRTGFDENPSGQKDYGHE